ncbi:hypothetical protein ACFL1R_03630 [Candidatus Latescibacterota bacterium]
MKEKDLRQLHRSIGIILAFFIVLQSLSGLMLNIENMFDKYWGIFHVIHYHFNQIGGIYRTIIGLGLVWMCFSGIMIYIKIRERKISN